jgi:transposase
VFQVHYIDQETGEIVNKPIKRAQFLEHFANRARCLIGMKRAVVRTTGPGSL